jgi:hypothetical protein
VGGSVASPGLSRVESGWVGLGWVVLGWAGLGRAGLGLVGDAWMAVEVEVETDVGVGVGVNVGGKGKWRMGNGKWESRTGKERGVCGQGREGSGLGGGTGGGGLRPSADSASGEGRVEGGQVRVGVGGEYVVARRLVRVWVRVGSGVRVRAGAGLKRGWFSAKTRERKATSVVCVDCPALPLLARIANPSRFPNRQRPASGCPWCNSVLLAASRCFPPFLAPPRCFSALIARGATSDGP